MYYKNEDVKLFYHPKICLGWPKKYSVVVNKNNSESFQKVNLESNWSNKQGKEENAEKN